MHTFHSPDATGDEAALDSLFLHSPAAPLSVVISRHQVCHATFEEERMMSEPGEEEIKGSKTGSSITASGDLKGMS